MTGFPLLLWFRDSPKTDPFSPTSITATPTRVSIHSRMVAFR
jgi:hypothetical protein